MHHLALLSLAVYEPFTAEEGRGSVEELTEQYEEKRDVAQNRKQEDPLLNALIAIARKLNGAEKLKKQKKKPMKPQGLILAKTKPQKAKKHSLKRAKKNLCSTAKRGFGTNGGGLNEGKSTTT